MSLHTGLPPTPDPAAQRQAFRDYLAAQLNRETPLAVLVLAAEDGDELDLFCGHDHRLVVAGASPETCDAWRHRATELELDLRVDCVDPRNLGEARLSRRFDLVVAGFGSLDLVPPECLPDFAATLAETVRESGRAVLVGRAPWCLWESAWFVLHLDWQRASDRRRQSRPGPPSDWCHGWTTVYRHTRPGFEVVRLMPLGVTVPPLSMPTPSSPPGRVETALGRLDGPLRRVPFLSGMSDHYLLDLRRRHDSVPGVLPAPVAAQ